MPLINLSSNPIGLTWNLKEKKTQMEDEVWQHSNFQ